MKPAKQESSPIRNYFRFARNIFGGELLENFLIASVASLLLIRLYLYLMGYPQLGGGTLHFAHMLWGGILMLVALFMSLGFLSRPAHEWAAVLGGIGFGAFIDELGKFITQDNDYFFQPAIAIIYVTFILFYLAIRIIFNYRPLTSRENQANVLELLKQSSLNGLDTRDEQMLNELLERCDPADSLTGKLKEMLPFIRVELSRGPHFMNHWKYCLENSYQRIISRWWFAGVVIAFFAFAAVSGFSAAAGIIAWPWTLILACIAVAIIVFSVLQFWHSRIPNLQIPLSGGVIVISILAGWLIVINRGNVTLPFVYWALFICSSISAMLIITGIVYMPHHRLRAYQMFQRGVLVSILLTHVFAFYEYQFFALIGLFINILILLTLRFMIHRELNPGESLA